MGRVSDEISESLSAFLLDQHLFFVGTAPRAADGHINVSPKGMSGTFAVISPVCVAYQDLTGSGIETVAHIRENGRIVIMFCAFEGPPRIVRLHGTGSVVVAGDSDFDGFSAHFAPIEGVRAIVVVDVERISDSCGYAVPSMEYTGDRRTLVEWTQRKGVVGLSDYREQKNAVSIDGLPGLPGIPDSSQ